MPNRFIPLLITPINRAPTRVPHTLPRPPARLVPPMTTAAITSSSYPWPATGSAELSREARIRALMAEVIPEIT